jgi:hypothetical protein
VIEQTRLFLRQRQHLPCPVGEALEHLYERTVGSVRAGGRPRVPDAALGPADARR